MKTIRLRPGKERSLLRRHPWIFESAIARGGADAGETVRVESDAGEFLAWAAFSPTILSTSRVTSLVRVATGCCSVPCTRNSAAAASFSVVPLPRCLVAV
jgi:23S rRNA (cytosine1962-C5)-methyltransferase